MLLKLIFLLRPPANAELFLLIYCVKDNKRLYYILSEENNNGINENGGQRGSGSMTGWAEACVTT